MAVTWQHRIIRYCLAQGFVEDFTPPTSTKYRKFRQVNDGPLGGLWYYLGKNGAVHISRHGTLNTAVSMTDMVQMTVRLWEKTPAGELARFKDGESL